MDLPDLQLVDIPGTPDDAVDSFVDCLLLTPQANRVRLVDDVGAVHALLGGVLWSFQIEAAQRVYRALREAAAVLRQMQLQCIVERLERCIALAEQRRLDVLRAAGRA